LGKKGKGTFLPPSQLHLYTEHDVYGMEYFRWPAWASSLAVLPPSSCTPAHLLGMGNWKKVLNFLAKVKIISVINMVLVLNPKYSSYQEGNYLYPRTGI